MMFIKYYIFFSLLGLTVLTTFSLRSLFDKLYEKIGLVLLWLVLIFTYIMKVNKLDLLWLVPVALLLPYYIYKVINIIQIRKFKFKLRNIMSLFF
jgi:hypothetical protein